MLRAVKIRLYPNKQQEVEFNKLLGCYRFVYNHMLDYKMTAYKEAKQNLAITDLSKHFHRELLQDENFSWLKEQNTKVMKQAIRQMLTAYDNFFNNHRGYPKFKLKKESQTALFPLEAISRNNTFETRHITLTKTFKNIPFRCSKLCWNRLRNFRDAIRSATLTKTKSGKYELSVLVEFPNEEFVKFKQTGLSVGVDLGVKDFAVTSDGEVFENKHFSGINEKKMSRLQRQLSKKQLGSNNRNKVRRKIAKLSEHITNQKDAYIHEVVNALLSNYDIVCMENLNISGMLKNHHIARAVQEVGMYKFKSILEYKAFVNGKTVVEVDRFYPSSKLCHNCGYKYERLSLAEREWTCPKCGTKHKRDENAAVNILSEGLRIIGSRTPEYKPVENPTVDDRSSEPKKRWFCEAGSENS